MKKRVKLLTTIASLCLAVALMAFGVYAATTADFSITSTVSFTAEKSVFVKLDVGVTGAVLSNGKNASAVTEGDTQSYDYSAAAGYTEKATEVIPLNNFEFTAVKGQDLVYTLTFSNYGVDTVYVKINNLPDAIMSKVNTADTLISVKTSDADKYAETKIFEIAPRTGTTPGQVSFTVTLTLERTDESIATPVSQDFAFNAATTKQA